MTRNTFIKSKSATRFILSCLPALGFMFLVHNVEANDSSPGSLTDLAAPVNKTGIDKTLVPQRAEKKQSDDSVASSTVWMSSKNLGIKIGIVGGILALFLIGFSKRKSSSSIPLDAVEVLGRVPFMGRQSLTLVRFGNKLVLVEVTPNGSNPISEITDPTEVQLMLAKIQSKRA